MRSMWDKLFIAVLALFIRCSFTQDVLKRPEFPDVFQTEVEGIFIKEKEIVELDGSLYYDRVNNRGALRFTYKGETSTTIYDFDNDETISIDGNDCVVNEILDDPEETFFPFTMDGNKKKLAAPEEVLFFSKSELEHQEFSILPVLVYTATIDIPAYGRKNCEVQHIFSKPDIERPACIESKLCEPSLLTISVKCKNDKGDLDVDHVYSFYRFTPDIKDESIFLPPAGVHCDMKNSKEFPPFPPYFSFTFDIDEKTMDSDLQKTVFSTHKAVWFDADYRIIRIDEFDYSGLLYSSRILDLSAQSAFTIVASVPVCDMGPIQDHIAFDEITSLPKIFFGEKDIETEGAVYVGTRKVHGLDYDVWSFQWTDTISDAKVVEEIYFQQIAPDRDISVNTTKKPYLKISHLNVYTYEETQEQTYDLTFLKHISINNYRTGPKEWSAFDVASCFSNKQKKDFILKIKGSPLAKESQSYREFLELLYNNIISVTNVSVLRINELTGVFDGVEIQEVRGSILDNSKMSEWQKVKEPGMDETYKIIQKAAAQGKLTVNFTGESGEAILFNVTSVEDYVLNVTRPEFPDLFQTEVEGVFIEEEEVVELDGTLYYDRVNNRLAFRYTYKAEKSTIIYNFDSDESISIDGNDCETNKIPDDPEESFFLFTIDGNTKKLVAPEEILLFSKSKLDHQELSIVPVLVYTATIDIPAYGRKNCDVVHFFSKPDVERPACIENELCEPSLLTISIKCKNEKDDLDIDHVYSFRRFTPGIKDESIFFPPTGVHCDMKNSKEFPPFPPYFSFTFDIFDKRKDSDLQKAVFSTHKEIWYDAEYKIIRIDESDYSGLLYSSRILDFSAETEFLIVATIPTCDIGPIKSHIDFDEVSRLPKVFFAQNDSTADGAVYVGKRKVHGLYYDVWSLEWTDTDSNEKEVEEIYFQQITPDQDFSVNTTKKPYLEISHVDLHTYEENNEQIYDLALFKHLSITNYRTGPKEWSAFDVATCFSNRQKKVFILKIKGPPLVKESQSYREVLELLYNNIISATSVSVYRINKLKGVFDGVEIQEVRGSILDNSGISEWQKVKEPGMDETYKRIQKAAAQGKLTVNFTGESGEAILFNVTSVEDYVSNVTRPKFPDLFQTEVEGIFIEKEEVVELDGTLYYDRGNNRLALRYTYKGKKSTIVYNFDSDETISIDGNDCKMNKIPDDPKESFFLFKKDGKTKKLVAPEEILLFSKSNLDHQELSIVPVLVYTATIDIPAYGRKNCDVVHFFSKPDVERPACIESELCEPSLLNISIKCKNETGDLDVDHVYSFRRFTPGINDESIFLPPAGVHCGMKNSKEFPPFPPYFSFTFDIIEKKKDSDLQKAVFSTHKAIWYDAEYKIIRIDEFDYSGLLYSSRILDLSAEIEFISVATVSTCDMGPIKSHIALDEASRLPKVFFAQNDSTADGAVYIGKRKVHGLHYDVWSLEWADTLPDAKIVEEIYFQQITSDQEFSVNTTKKPYLEISHVDLYTYNENNQQICDLTLFKHLSINNYRTGPKEWSAFDVAACFSSRQKKNFILKIKGPPLVKESQSYREVLELLYNNIISATSVSIYRINKLTGVFDGVELQEVRGSIIDNSKTSEWQKDKKEPGMDETFKRIQTAAAQGKLTVSFRGENGKDIQFIVTSVEEEKASKGDTGYSGVAMAVASIVLFLIGIFLGVSGYYVFLKKRKSVKDDTLYVMQSIES